MLMWVVQNYFTDINVRKAGLMYNWVILPCRSWWWWTSLHFFAPRRETTALCWVQQEERCRATEMYILYSAKARRPRLLFRHVLHVQKSLDPKNKADGSNGPKGTVTWHSLTCSPCTEVFTWSVYIRRWCDVTDQQQSLWNRWLMVKQNWQQCGVRARRVSFGWMSHISRKASYCVDTRCRRCPGEVCPTVRLSSNSVLHIFNRWTQISVLISSSCTTAVKATLASCLGFNSKRHKQ